jgi:enoyl-CoA hydratase/carnithine racemase
VVFGHGEHFTGGLDLVDVGPTLLSGESLYPADASDPWRLDGTWSTPIIVAVQGWVMTLGIELMLAADIRIAAADARFSQYEIRRGIYPFGGATFRFPREVGWGNAMRWLLTGDEFDAAEAHRIGLVQELTEHGDQLARALAIAEVIAEQAPLAVYATLAASRHALPQSEAAATARLFADLAPLVTSDDMQEGLRAFVERRPGRFRGR